MLDETYSAARVEYARTILAILTNIEDWIVIDSWLGGGKATDSKRREGFAQAYAEFWGVATVVSMAAELAEAAVTMAEKHRYTQSAQSFGSSLSASTCSPCLMRIWIKLACGRKAHPTRFVSPSRLQSMRKLLAGRFSNEEYWKHCSTGGHPAPKGARLLEKLDPRRLSWPYQAAELATDLGLHLQRTWAAVDAVLSKHHARYVQVRADQRQQAEEAWTRWRNVDPLVATLTGFESEAPVADSAADRESPPTSPV